MKNVIQLSIVKIGIPINFIRLRLKIVSKISQKVEILDFKTVLSRCDHRNILPSKLLMNVSYFLFPQT